MSSPYGVTIEFYLDGTEDLIFHELEGLEDVPKEGSTLYLNDVEYKVESSTLYLYDSEVVNSNSGENQWSMGKVLYKIYLSVPVV